MSAGRVRGFEEGGGGGGEANEETRKTGAGGGKRQEEPCARARTMPPRPRGARAAAGDAGQSAPADPAAGPPRRRVQGYRPPPSPPPQPPTHTHCGFPTLHAAPLRSQSRVSTRRRARAKWRDGGWHRDATRPTPLTPAPPPLPKPSPNSRPLSWLFASDSQCPWRPSH